MPGRAPNPRRQRTTIEVHRDLDALAPLWSGPASAGRNVFGSHEWLSTWWHHFGRDRELILGVLRDGHGDVVALLPLYLAMRRPVRVVRFLGHGPTDQLGPVGPPDRRTEAGRLIAAVLDEAQVAWDVLIADELPGGTDWPTVLDGTRLGRQASPVVDLHGGFEAWLAARSTNLRSSISRGRRELERRGTVRIRHTVAPDELDRDLESLLRLHALRWQATGGSRAFARREAFHRDITRRALERGWLRLWSLEVDGRPVAALYNLRYAGTECFYQSGRDPAFDRGAPGLVLHAHAIEQACADGVDEYRLLRGDEPYKRRFTEHDAGLESVAVARTARGAAAAALVRPLPLLPRWAVRRVPAPLAWGTGAAPIWGAP